MQKSIILFGAGYWGKNHLRELNNNQDVSSLFVVDPLIHSNQDLIKNYQNVHFFTSVDEIFRKNLKIDGAVIASPPSTHFELAKKCLENNLHVLVEKPMVETSDELEILNILSGENKVLMSGHTYLFNPAIQAIKNIIDSGELGQIMFIHSQRLNFGIMRKDTDVFMSLAPHDISLVQYFMNDAKYLDMKISKYNFTFSPNDDFSSTGLFYDNSVYAQIDVSWYYPEKVRSLKIVGTKKSIIFDDVNKKITLHDISINSNYDHRDNGIINVEFDKNVSPLKNELIHFLSYFDNPSSCITGYSHTKNVIKVLEEYYK
jgi:predicted dehydrogenase